jgi:putative endonuclease
MAKHIELGKKGEDLAVSFLELKGYSIIERNWRYRRAEIDIIAKLDDKLVFIEVKTRSTDVFGNPEEAVHLKKQDLIARAAGAYILKVQHDWLIRYDVVSILLFADGTYAIEHIEDAFF